MDRLDARRVVFVGGAVRAVGPTLEFPCAADWRARGIWRDETVWDAFARTAARRPTATALVDGDVRCDFATLAAQAARVAGALAARGVGRGDRVALVLPSWCEGIVTLLACARLGAVAVPALPIHGEHELRVVLGRSQARICVVAPGAPLDVVRGLRAALPCLAHVIVARGAPPADVEPFAELLAAAPLEAPCPAAPADVALVLHTSGTTAEPKGVLHTHETLLAEARSLGPAHGLAADDVALVPSSTGHIAGIVHGLLVPAVHGAAAVLLDRWDAAAALARIAREGVTYAVGAPVLLRELAAQPAHRRETAARFRLFSCGGADVDPVLVADAASRLGCVVKRVYGSTEFPTITTTGPDDPPARRADSDGRPIGAVELAIVDAEDRPVPVGTEGEIVARGPDCCVGYDDPARTAESFTPDGWFRTGDLGRLDGDGFLHVTGRRKDVIIRKGENISAPEVEALLASHPAVGDVAVVGLPDPDAGEIACAVVVPRPGGAPPSLADLGAHLRRLGLSTRKHPERLVLLDALPRTASGKVIKRALRFRLLESP